LLDRRDLDQHAPTGASHGLWRKDYVDVTRQLVRPDWTVWPDPDPETACQPACGDRHLPLGQHAITPEFEHTKTPGALHCDHERGIRFVERTHANDQVTTRKHAQVDSSSTPAGNGM
jgi:hypothetical protein